MYPPLTEKRRSSDAHVYQPAAFRRRRHGERLLKLVALGLFMLLSCAYIWNAGGFDGLGANDPHQRFDIPADASGFERAVVVPKVRGEDISWLKDVVEAIPNTTIIPYTLDRRPEHPYLRPATRRGREAAAYLTYLVTYYDALPAYTFFVHAAATAWHNDVSAPTASLLRSFRLPAAEANGYFNLRCASAPGCPIAINPTAPTAADLKRDDTRARLARIYTQLFAVPADAVPAHLGAPCCSQFVVTRERIRARPRADYERMLRWAAETAETDSFGVGWVFEMVWQVVFGAGEVVCPRVEQCRCDGFGWCGPLAGGGEVLVPVGGKGVG